MKKRTMKSIIGAGFIVALVCVFNILPIKIQAITTTPIEFQEDLAYVYNDVKADTVYHKGIYYCVVPVIYGDGTYNTVVLTSSDQKHWNLLSQLLERSQSLPTQKALRILNDVFIISVKNYDGAAFYVSHDSGVNWKVVGTDYEDISFYGSQYWAIDAKGVIFYSSDLLSWVRLTQMTSSQTVALNPLNLCVTDNLIIVSHYNPKWGGNNYKHGLEVYDRKGSKWLETTGYNQVKGTTRDIVWTGESFILAYQNDYGIDSTVVFYTSKDGVNWAIAPNKTELIRMLYPIRDTDTNMNKLIKIITNLIESEGRAGVLTAVLVELDGKTIQFDEAAVLKDGRVLVPVRNIFEALGGTMTWSSTLQQVKGQVGANSVQLTINSKTAYFNNKAVTLDVPAMIIGGRTFVPVRFVADSLGKEVSWDGSLYIVKLNTPAK